MDNSSLLNVFIFLVIACVVVALAGRFKLGSVLGYLAAGVLVGPFVLGFIDNSEEIMRFAEFGVVMMLFVIGLELEPPILWRMRRKIIGLGGLQVAVTSLVFTAAGMALGFDWKASLACGMALSLSSTALVLQMLEEKDLLKTNAGESSFAVLLFQDIAVIPILVIMPLLAVHGGEGSHAAHASAISHLPGWAQTLIIGSVITAIVIGGRYMSRPVFYFLAKTKLREVFTATSLAIVVGITWLMQWLGVSPALGAFIAGVVLANSEYRHTLETDIQPFKSLLIALFFMSIGMGINMALLGEKPWLVLGIFLGLMLFKALILSVLGRFFGVQGAQNALFAGALAQGGEFSFVLFQYASGLAILSPDQNSLLTLAVTLSMLATPFLMLFNERYVMPRFVSLLPKREYDAPKEDGSIIIAGYGRFGQIIGRFLTAQGVKVTILEENPDQIEQLHKFGVMAYFGDASRLDLLRSAGAERAKLLVVAIDDPDKSLEIVRLAHEHFPTLTVFARARNRRHAYELYKAGIDYSRREMFDSSLRMAQEIMKRLGANAADMEHKAQQFMEHDEKTLLRSFAFFEKEAELISFSRQASGELQQILQEDITPNTAPLPPVPGKD